MYFRCCGDCKKALAIVIQHSEEVNRSGWLWCCLKQTLIKKSEGDPQRSLPTPTILWFCDSVWILLLSALCSSELGEASAPSCDPVVQLLWSNPRPSWHVPLHLVPTEDGRCLYHGIGWLDFNNGTFEFQLLARPVVTGVTVCSCAKARQVVMLGPVSLTGLRSSTQKSSSTFLYLDPSRKEKSVCSPKLRNCPQQLESTATIQWFWLHLFLSMRKLLPTAAGGLCSGWRGSRVAGQGSTDVCLGDWADLMLRCC